MRKTNGVVPFLLAGALALASGGARAAGEAEAPVAGSPDENGLDLPALLAKVDEMWSVRDEPGRLEDVRALLDRAEALAPKDYGVLWRQARLYFWLADDPALDNQKKSELGKRAWDYGDRASAIEPRRVEGWFFAAGGMGNYALGIGILKALGEGIEGKFKDRLSRAERIDPGYYAGGIWVAWGRFYFKLPWPKYDPKKSERMFEKALQVNPNNVRGRFFLAELYEKEGDKKEARRLLEEAVALAPGSYDAPEERRSVRLAREKLAELNR
jgi:tetratricopeptide (TPR) repeat protein